MTLPRALQAHRTELLVLLVAIAAATGLVAFRNRDRGDDRGLRLRYYANPAWQGSPAGEAVVPRVEGDSARSPFFRRAGSAEWLGSIAFPESGRYSLCLQADPEGSIALGELELLRVHQARLGKWRCAHVDARAGAKSIRVRWRQLVPGKGFLRLLWEPSGPAWEPQHVPRDVLFPVPPEQADWRAASITPVEDAFVWTALLLIGIGVVAFLRRRALRDFLAALRTDSARRRDVYLFGGIFLFALAVRVYDLGGAGELCDEAILWSQGRNFLGAWLSGDFREETWRLGWQHTPLTKYIVGYGSLWSESLAVPRLFSAIFGALSCVVAYLLGRELFGSTTALFGALVTALLPHLVGHSKVAGHEAPSLLLQSLTVLCFLRAVRSERNSRGYLLAGVTAGLAISLRQTNLVLAPALLLIFLIERAARAWRERQIAVPLNLLFMPLIVVAVVFALWPLLWIKNPLSLFTEIRQYWGGPIDGGWFLGEKAKPWYYLPLYAVATTPVVVLAGVALSFPRMVLRSSARATFILFAWLGSNLLLTFLHAVQDGIRYALPALVPMALLAGAGFAWVVDAIAARIAKPSAQHAVVAGTAALVGVALLLPLVRIHPYYIDYYSEVVGGLPKVAARRLFRVSWWNEGTEPAMRKLNALAPPGAKVHLATPPAAHIRALRPDIRIVSFDQADYALVNPHLVGRAPPTFEKIDAVEVWGVPLVEIYRRKGG